MEAGLYILSLVGSGLGFMTQMLVSGYWTTAFSQDVFYYSINLAFYLLAMGIGSLLSNRLQEPKVKSISYLVIVLSAIAGCSVPFLRWGIKVFGEKLIFPVCVVVSAGVLCGMLIPLILKVGQAFPRMSVGLLFFIDYGAAVVVTLVFTFILLVPLGYSKTGLLLSLVSTLIVFAFLGKARLLDLSLGGMIVATFLIPLLAYSGSRVMRAPNFERTGEAQIIHNEQSHYQRIILTEENVNDGLSPETIRNILYLDGFLQFSSRTEHRYHFCLSYVPAVAASHQKRQSQRVLILGGGDGLVARDFLKNPQVKDVTLVELDPAMIRLAKENSVLRKRNLDSFYDPRVNVIIGDAFRWVQENRVPLKGSFDLMVIDFPFPKNLTLSRLFSAEFYRSALELLSPGGFAAIQSGPSFLIEDPTKKTLSKVTASILKTLRSIGYYPYPYALPQDGEAFVLVTSDPTFDMDAFARTIGMYQGGMLSLWCRYDRGWREPAVEINTLNTLRMSRYMLDWFRQSGEVSTFYRGNHLIFLPD